MDWIYLVVLVAGCCVFLFKIISTYLSQSSLLKPQIEQVEIEKEHYETQTAEYEKGTGESQERLKDLQQQIEIFEKQRAELRQKVRQQREATQKKGPTRSR